jgi:cyanophycinase
MRPHQRIGPNAIIGGAAKSPEIFSAIREASGRPKPRLAVLMGSKQSLEAARTIFFDDEMRDGKIHDPSTRTFLEGMGFEPIFIPLALDNREAGAFDPEVVKLVESCDAAYFVGGDQAKHVRALLTDAGEDTPVMAAVRRLHEAGGVIAGTSAGAHAQGARQYGEGRVYEYLVENRLDTRAVRDATLQDPKDPDLGSLGPGLGLLPESNALVCTHFDARYRLGRLLVAMKETDRHAGLPPSGVSAERTLGIGVDENTALLIKDGVGTVFGEGGVFIVDASQARFGDSGPFSANGLRLHYLSPGDSYDFASRSVSSTKPEVAAGRGAKGELVARDFLRPHEATRLIERLLASGKNASAVGLTNEDRPRFLFMLGKDAQTRAHADESGDVTGAGLTLSVACLG